MAVYGMHEVRLEDVLRVIFDHLEPVWLARIWFGGGDRCSDMIDMIYEMYLELSLISFVHFG
jgi:hypothetical protein